jgi:hypothetical protein
MRLQDVTTVQAGMPMTVTGDVSLLPWMGAGRRLYPISCLKISRGPGQRPGGQPQKRVLE